MYYAKILNQGDLVSKYNAQIPIELKYHIAQTEIRSPIELTDEKIKSIVRVMIESAIYSHIGFGGSPSRAMKLMKCFEQLKAEKIEFTILASTSARAKNIYFPNSFF